MSQFLPSLVVLTGIVVGAFGVLALLRCCKPARSHWVAFLFLLPFPVMLWIHHALGFSDAMMIQAAPGEKEAYLYNFVMVGVAFLGVAGFIAHTWKLAAKSPSWLVMKFSVFTVYWVAILICAN